MTDDTETSAVPAKDPAPSPSQVFLSQYIPISAVFTGDTRDPRASLAMRQKAADIALALTQTFFRPEPANG